MNDEPSPTNTKKKGFNNRYMNKRLKGAWESVNTCRRKSFGKESS